MACGNNCGGCRYADRRWRDYSQLPTCVHPEIVREFKKGIWTLYVAGEHGLCTPKRILKKR